VERKRKKKEFEISLAFVVIGDRANTHRTVVNHYCFIMSRAGSASKSGPMAAKATSANKAKINVIYYSMYGHVATCKFRFITYKIRIFCSSG
jgi:hypothetical protein